MPRALICLPGCWSSSVHHHHLPGNQKVVAPGDSSEFTIGARRLRYPTRLLPKLPKRGRNKGFGLRAVYHVHFEDVPNRPNDDLQDTSGRLQRKFDHTLFKLSCAPRIASRCPASSLTTTVFSSAALGGHFVSNTASSSSRVRPRVSTPKRNHNRPYTAFRPTNIK